MMKEQLRINGIIKQKGVKMSCERNIEITSDEVKELMSRVQKFNSIRTIDLIIKSNPNIVDEFCLDKNIFTGVETELVDVDKDCRKWWDEICEKYKLQKDSSFKVDYESCVLTLL